MKKKLLIIIPICVLVISILLIVSKYMVRQDIVTIADYISSHCEPNHVDNNYNKLYIVFTSWDCDECVKPIIVGNFIENIAEELTRYNIKIYIMIGCDSKETIDGISIVKFKKYPILLTNSYELKKYLYKEQSILKTPCILITDINNSIKTSYVFELKTEKNMDDVFNNYIKKWKDNNVQDNN